MKCLTAAAVTLQQLGRQQRQHQASSHAVVNRTGRVGVGGGGRILSTLALTLPGVLAACQLLLHCRHVSRLASSEASAPLLLMAPSAAAMRRF